MHPIDFLGSALMRLDRRRLGIFPDGWGDRLNLELLERVPPRSEVPPEIDVVWGRKEEHPGFRIRKGWFTSPIAGLLQPESRVVTLEMVEPASGSENVVVMLPAWNDHGSDTRRKLAYLLVARGIGTVMCEAPLYGSRRVVPAPAQAVRTVADFALMGYGAVVEARAVLAGFASTKRVGVSGYSMGGNLAALVSALMPCPVATAPLAASHSPGPVYLDGVLARAINWRALGGEKAAVDLRSLLSSVSVLDIRPPDHVRNAIIVGASRDGFVPPSATRALAAHWQGSELRWVDAGHGTLLARHRPLLADAITDAFDKQFGS
jgi:hypothetical protein